MSTIRELLARHVPDLDTTLTALPSDPGPQRMTRSEQAALWRERAIRRHRALTDEHFAAVRLDDTCPPQVAAWVRAYVKGTAGTRHSLMLSGRVGRGKTHLAYGALAAIAESGVRDAAWAGGTVAHVFARMRPNSGEDRHAVYRELTETPILLLDDLGAAKSTDWTEETFLDLIDTRSRRNRPVIVTTNATPTELRAVIGDRAVSRLAGMCVEFKFPDRAPDRRLA